ncbi:MULTISPECIES: DUF2062 domain-containing protein [Acinetobacter]|uniref:DUF2062 domain-containing protein n=1 Tax=Acinetobacter TaxID=469 RepID=UPI00197BFE88|nr:DUF2062 domain-containing protein [Acinetobacter sp. ANC 3781]
MFMAKQFFQSWLPSPHKVAEMKLLKIFGKRTLNPLLWYVNRKSISKAIFIGTFWGMLPLPFHSILIVLTVLLFEVNLPVSLCLAWLTNPFTLVPILYIGFWLGAKVFQVNMIDQDMILGVLHQISHWITHFGKGHVDLSLAKILLSGLLLEALIFAVILFMITRLFWRWNIIQHYKRRQSTP